MQPTVAIVILNWNGRTFLERFLPSVTATTYKPCTVHVIDNASTDDSVSYLQNNFPEIGIIQLSRNLGFARGYNEGLKQVNADYYVLLNSDVEVTPGWIDPVIEWMEKEPMIGACQPKILQYAQKDHFEYAGAAGGWIDLFGYPFARGRIFDHCEKDEGQYDTPSDVCWASGAAFFVRPALYHAAGGFDAGFHAHMEEIDLCWRLQSQGYRITCCPRSVVYHVGGGSLPKGSPLKVYLNFRNNLIMLGKNLPLSRAIVILPIRLFLDVVAAVKHILSGEPAFFTSILRAHWAFLGWLFGKRSNFLKAPRRSMPRYGLYRGSIVWKHFANGARAFSEIVR